ncbi:MAG: toll/interleukin-1 receptor domain-containing protein [Allosphingosinicella sp.]
MFFASYARLDNDKKRLRTVILDLRERVRGKLGASDASTVGFFDAEDGIPAASEWARTLGDAARQARVLVCFCSNTYFNSEFCANEFEIFRRRLEKVKAAAANYNVILPVIWDPGSMPLAVSRHQDSATSQGFPDDYRRHGLLALRRNRTAKSQAAYNAALDAIATVIHAAVNKPALPPLAPPIVFEDLPGVFDNPGPYSLRIGGLHAKGLRWELQPGQTLRFLVEEVVATEHRAWRVMKVDDGIAGDLEDAASAREGVILIADASAIAGGAWKVRASKIDVAAGKACRVLVGIRDANGAGLTPDAATTQLQALMPGLAGHGTAIAFDADDPLAFKKLLAEQMVVLNMSMVAEDDAARINDSSLANDALRDGITVATRPSVAGPDGRTL